MTAIASVVIPAHNEEASLRRCLDHLLRDATVGEFEVLVVPNGCQDHTAEVAASFADHGVRSIEIAEASKIAALRCGDRAATAFPRIFLDADVVISTATARALVSALSSGDHLAAAPRLRLDTSNVRFLARYYLRVWAGLPVFEHAYVGSGCYALSQSGRARFGDFPDVMSDDQFVNDLFASAEKLTLSSHTMTITPPTGIRAIVRRSLRVRAGRLALAADSSAHGPRTGTGTGTGTGKHLRGTALARPRDAPSVLLFLAVQVLITIVARVRRSLGRDEEWLRDETSRVA